MKKVMFLLLLTAMAFNTIGATVLQQDTMMKHRKHHKMPKMKKMKRDTARWDTMRPRSMKKDTMR